MATSETTVTKNGTFRSACYTQHKVDAMLPWDVLSKKIRYMAHAEETCPTTEKKHLQGFAYAKTPMRLTQWKKLLPHAHIEQMHGTFQDNEDYCSKEGKLEEFGTRPFQGERKDLIDLKRKLDQLIPPLEIADNEEYFGVVAKHHNFAEKYYEFKKSKVLKSDRTLPNVYVLTGPTGCGKTSWLDAEFGVGNWTKLPCPTGGTWWWTPECARSDHVLIDDVNSKKIPEIGTVLEWTDRYPFQAPIKGGFCWAKPKSIVFTSNVPRAEWWPFAKAGNLAAFERRITMEKTFEQNEDSI